MKRWGYSIAKYGAQQAVDPWQQLDQRTRRTTPVTVARYALVIGALAALVWLANTAWQSLVPFVVGGFIAYAVLPFVNRLDRIMPRWFASLLVVVGVLAFIALFIATLVPLILQQVLVLINSLPKADQLQQSTAQINQSLTTLPEPLRVAGVLDLAGKGFRGEVQVRVAEVMDRRLTLLTIAGHPIAGAVRFLVEPREGAVRFEIQVYDRPATVIDQIMMRTVGEWLQRSAWVAMTERVGKISGGSAGEVQSSSEELTHRELELVDAWASTLSAQLSRNATSSGRD